MPTSFRALCGAWAVSGIIALAALAPAHAAPPTKKGKRPAAARPAIASPIGVGTSPRADSGYEKSLLGIRVLQSYKDVLRRFGQPTYIFRLDESLRLEPEFDVNGQPTGGVLDVISLGNANKDSTGLGNGQGNSSDSSNPDDNPPDPNANPGDPNANPANGGPTIPGSFGNANEEKKPETFGQAGGFVWVYRYQIDKKAYIFAFNRDGRAIAILESGLGIGMPTSRGITLGSSAGSVFSNYGYPDSNQETDFSVQLFYDIKHHCQFDIVKNRVNLILVGLTEGIKFRHTNDQNSGGGRGGAPNRPGGPPPRPPAGSASSAGG